jgi:hypothetical protein
VATLITLILSAGLVTTGELLRASAGGPVVPAGERFEPSVDLAARARAAVSRGGFSDSIALDAAPLPQLPLPETELASLDEVVQRLRSNAKLGRGVAVIGATATTPTTGPALTLARALSGDAKAVLVCLVPVSAALESTGLEPHSAGLADVVRGAASFGQVIRRDKQSRLHLVGYGWPDLGIDAILGSRRFTTMIEALAKAYDQVLIDAGGFDSGTLRLAAVAPRGVVIASQDSLKEAESASRMLTGAGFTDVAVMTAVPAAPASRRTSWRRKGEAASPTRRT